MDALSSPSSPNNGLAATASALRRAQDRFDTAAAAQVQAAQDLTLDPAADTDQAAETQAAAIPDLAHTTADLVQERLLNQVLVGVFRAQDQQQQELLKLRT